MLLLYVIFTWPKRKNSFRNALPQPAAKRNSPFLKMAPSFGQTPPWAATAINRPHFAALMTRG